jgi:hypothetical protein
MPPIALPPPTSRSPREKHGSNGSNAATNRCADRRRLPGYVARSRAET